MVTIQPVNTTYEPVSLEPEYIEANWGFVRRAKLDNVERFLDIACGAGTVSRMLVTLAPDAHLNGIDLDPVQIELSTKEFVALGYEVRHEATLTNDRANGKPVICLTVGSGDELPYPDGVFDCATIANAIHMLPDKPKFLAEVRRVLKPGGLFGFNSVFYAGANPPGTDKHFWVWLKEATAYIEAQNKRLKAEGQPTIRRVHGTTRTAFQNKWYTPEEWTAMLADAGFQVSDLNERVVQLSESCLAAFGAYAGIAEVVMSGYPVEAASVALQATAGASLKAMGLTTLPRQWLEIWARKSPA